jgi:molybdenum cofactor guanylyltransferase
MLLTGGTSRRMGRDKADLVVEGERLADRTARVLAQVCAPVLEVGPGRSRLDSVLEDPPGGGPLVAVAAGRRGLLEQGYAGPAVVLAVDMAAVEPPLLHFLATFPGEGSVVPFVTGRAQPLCARYSAATLAVAERLAAGGERSMRALVHEAGDLQWAGPRMWGAVVDDRAFLDLDTPADLERLREGTRDVER